MEGLHHSRLPARNVYHSGRTTVERTCVIGNLSGHDIQAVPDNCSTHNLIAYKFLDEYGLTSQMALTPMSVPMAGKKRLNTIGVISLPFNYHDRPSEIHNVKFLVLDQAAYPILFGYEFLNNTEPHLNPARETLCTVSTGKHFSLCLVDTTRDRLDGYLRNTSGVYLPHPVIMDRGSIKNVISFHYAQQLNLKIRNYNSQLRHLVLADGSLEPVIGYVETWYRCPNGLRAPLTLEVTQLDLENIIIGDEFLRQYRIMVDHPDWIITSEAESHDAEILCIGYRERWYEGLRMLNFGRTNKFDLDSIPLTAADFNYEAEEHRQEKWDNIMKYGECATLEEWYREHARRERYQRFLSPTWVADRNKPPLILRSSYQLLRPLGADSTWPQIE